MSDDDPRRKRTRDADEPDIPVVDEVPTPVVPLPEPDDVDDERPTPLVELPSAQPIPLEEPDDDTDDDHIRRTLQAQQQADEDARQRMAILHSQANLAELDESADRPGRRLLEDQVRRTHFITFDAQLMPVRTIQMAHHTGLIRYATWCHEIGEQGHHHWHLYVELYEPHTSTWLKELLFGTANIDFHLFIQPVLKNRYAARFYIRKLCSKDMEARDAGQEHPPLWHEYGIWLDPNMRGSLRRPPLLDQ